jgi:hypothetical protein
MTPGIIRRATVLLWAAIATPLAAQEAECRAERADKVLTITYPVSQPRDSLLARADTVLAALGYTRPANDYGKPDYRALPRAGWPLGTERAPWRRAGPGPGVKILVKFRGRGRAETEIQVRAEALCAVNSRKESRDQTSTEHYATLFAAMQIVTAFSAGVDAALHAFDQ